MKHVQMMILASCPHCRKAFALIDELKQANPAYRQVEIEVIDEEQEPQRAAGFDYWYVPTFYVDGQKIHEGVPSREAIENALKAAL